MKLLLPATCTALDLHEALTNIDPLTVSELDLTNCVIATIQDGLSEYIGLCTNLQSLKCVACPIHVSNLLWLLQGRLPKLENLEFSLSLRHSDINKEIGKVIECLRQVPRKTGNNLREVYVEMWGDENAVLLRWMLALCLNVTAIHAHLARGDVRLCLLQMESIILQLPRLSVFTFSSDVPAAGVDEPFPMTVLNKHALVCANVSVCDGVYNCVWLRDIVLDPTHREPFAQLIVVFDKTDDLAHRITEAAHGHDWADVCCLALVLAAQKPLMPLPMAEGAYLSGLREFFSAFRCLVQLNIASFHFGVDIDVTLLLRDAGLESLQALSTPPCALGHRHAVRRLAEACPQLVELDVRMGQSGTQLGCTVCEQLEFQLDSDDMIALQEHGPPHSRSRLVRLTLNGMPRLESLLFLEHCKVDELRLVDCADVSQFTDIGNLLALNNMLTSLLIRNAALPFGTCNLLDNMTCARRLQYLCLLSDVPVSDDIAQAHVTQLANVLLQLICVHVHYRSMETGREQRITWLRDTVEIAKEGHFFRDGPCIICSTATFIALVKPKNRDCLT
ncbi:uncharacterized protein LOC142776564 isoform X3 [Rhipicephalus microplus]|uniref:uncharacterized protein LOC142776564 isoform X3 n=1 Tax=Rhipicephalus microplus TaxID=6941 RepID=UPI003F6A5FB4